MKRLAEKEQERIKFREDTQVKVKQVIHAKPLYKQLEEKYVNEIEMP